MKPKVLFTETPYTDDPYFEHFDEDMYRLYKFKNKKEINLICEDLFMMSHKDVYKFRNNLQDFYEEQKENVKFKNNFFIEHFKEKKVIKLSDLLIYLGDFEVYNIPDTFQINVISGKMITQHYDSVTALFLGEDGNYYYYEYLTG